jgi:hypothetical protein
VRKLLIVLMTSLAAMGVHAWEPTTADVQPENMTALEPNADVSVTIAAIPMPAQVVELARYSPRKNGLGQSKKVKAAKVAIAKSMLSRSARQQIAIASTSSKPDDKARLLASENEDAGTGFDMLDLHRSFSQPRVAKVADQADDDDEAVSDLPDHIKLRLLMARTKAVEAHILNQVGKASDAEETELSDTVKLRLYLARARAVKAHSEKYGAA